MMQGTKILCFTKIVQLILFLNLVINVNGFYGFN